MSRNPLISVIIPVYNVEAYLPGCIQSALNQTYENLEILLVDDGSTDGSGKICDAYAEKDPRIRVIHQKNQGQALARNHALDQIRGQYVAFLDSDDSLEPDGYQVLMEKILTYQVKLACGGRFNQEEETGIQEPGLCPAKEEVISSSEMLRRLCTWDGCDSSPCDKLFSSSLFEGLRFPEESGSEDVGLIYRLVLKAGEAVMVPKPFYHYLQRKGSTSYGQVNPQIFNFEKQARRLYEDLCIQAPEVKDAARYMLVRSLYVSVVLLDQADPEQRRKYRDQLKKSRRDLRKNWIFILRSPYFEKKERARDLLMAFGLYRFFRKIFHRDGQEP